MASEVLIKIPAVSFSQVKGVEEVTLMAKSAQSCSPGGTSPVSPTKEAALQHAAQLEHNIRFLREQHHVMLTSLHKEVESLRQRNRELQFQLVMSSAASSAPISLLQDIPDSPEDDTRPRVILSPRQPNLSPLQVEILEKDLAELRIDLKEERDKNQHLYGIVQEQQKKIELLKVVSTLTPKCRDAQCQAGAAGCAELGRKLEETQRVLKAIRRENEEQRKELSNLKVNMSRGQVEHHHVVGGGSSSSSSAHGSRDTPGYVKETAVAEVRVDHEQSHESSRPNSAAAQHRFPPLQNTGYWQQQQQQQQHRPGMEFNGSSRSGHHGHHGRLRQHDKPQDTSSLGGSRSGRTTLPALHGNMYVFSQQSNNNNRRNSGNHFYNNNNGGGGGGSRQGYYRGPGVGGAVGIRAEEPFEQGIQGRKYRGGGGRAGQRERQLQ